MGQPTYKDFLQWLGLSNWQFVLLASLILALYPLITSLWKMKIVGNIKIHRIKMNGFRCVYISYLGSYNDFNCIYNQCVQDFKMVFKFSNYFAIFYDDPSDKPQSTMSKALIGVLVKDIQNCKIELFKSKFPQYKIGNIAACNCLLSILPLTNLSPIMAIARVYPAMFKKLQEEGIKLKYRQIIQIYHENDEKTAMSVLRPITEEDQFQLWYQPSAYSRVDSNKEK